MKRGLVVGSALVAVAAVSAVAVYAWSARTGPASADVTPRPHLHLVSVGHPARARGRGPLTRIPVRYPLLTTGDHGTAVTRLDQLLAAAGYLPLRFHPKGRTPLLPLQPRRGKFVWKFTPPAELASLWQAGTYSTVTRGAVMTLQSDRGLPVDGVAGPQVWRALLGTPAHHAAPYTYVVVHETVPESIDVYRDGHSVFSSAANTGIAAAPTVQGTWPVYLRYTSTTMSGTNPDGTHYSDPGVPWVSYFNGGDAVHGFLRASYGSPQSLGCVELPYGAAQQAYQLMSYGTLVTVTS